MEPATDGKSLEKRLKVAALAWACTLTPPTGFVTPEPPSPDGLYNFISAVLGHLRCCLTSNPMLTLFLRFLDDDEAIKRWHEKRHSGDEAK